MVQITRITRFIIFTLIMIFGLLSAQEYAFMYTNYSGTNQEDLPDSTLWYTLGSIIPFVEGPTSTNWSFSNNALVPTVSAAGNYTIMYSFSFKPSGTRDAHYDVGISIGNADPTYYSQRYVGSTKETGNISGVINLAITDTSAIRLKLRCSDQPVDVLTYNAQVAVLEHEEPSSTNYYAEMNISGNSTALTGINETWNTQTGFSLGTTNGFTESGSVLTAGSSSGGKYLAILSASLIGQNQKNYRVGVSVDDANPTEVVARRYFSSGVGVIYACGIIDVTATTGTIRIKGICESGNFDLTFENASLTLIKVNNSSTSTSPYGGMYASLNTTATNVLVSDTWYQVTAGMDPMTNNSFTHSGGTLTPTGLSAGTYLVNYSAGLLAPIGNVIQVYTSIFVNGSEQVDLTTVRDISSATSVGSIGGTGLITLTQDNSNQPVTMQVKNVTTSSTDNITVKFARVSLHRILISGDGSLPVELLYFKGIGKDGAAELFWETGSEIENLGFVLERRYSDKKWSEIASFKDNTELQGQGSSTAGTKYYFCDKSVISGKTYEYRLIDVDYAGNIKQHDPIKVYVKPQADKQNLPKYFVLKPAYPNPFNPFITINYELLEESHVNVTIYNLLGQPVRTLVNAELTPGVKQVTWDGIGDGGVPASAGVYFNSIEVNGIRQMEKLVLVK